MIRFGEGEAEHPTIRAFGCGGAGCNIVKELAEQKLPGVEPIFLNMGHELDAAHYNHAMTVTLDLDHKMANEPKHAEAATWRAHETLTELIRGTHLAFIICGLGGTTGSGAAPALAEILKKEKKVAVALTVHPFRIEGHRRERNTRWCIERLKDHAHGIVCIHNDKLMTLAPDISFGQALQVTNRMALMPVMDIAALATKKDMRNIRAALDCSEIHIGFGGSNRDLGLHRSIDEVKESLMPGPCHSIQDCDKAILSVRMGPGLLKKDAENLAGIVAAELHPKAKVLWGTIEDDTLGHGIRIMSIIGKGRE